MEQNCLLDNWCRSSSASMECSGCGEGAGYTYSRIYSPPNCVITCYLLLTRTAKVHRLHCISPNHVKCAVYWASKSGCSSTARGMLPLISDVCDVAGSTLMQHKLGTDKIAHKTSTEMTPDSSEIMAEAVSPCFTYLIVFYQHRGATLYIGSVRFRSFNKNRLPTMQVSFSLHVPTWSFFREILACLEHVLPFTIVVTEWKATVNISIETIDFVCLFWYRLNSYTYSNMLIKKWRWSVSPTPPTLKKKHNMPSTTCTMYLETFTDRHTCPYLSTLHFFEPPTSIKLTWLLNKKHCNDEATNWHTTKSHGFLIWSIACVCPKIVNQPLNQELVVLPGFVRPGNNSMLCIVLNNLKIEACTWRKGFVGYLSFYCCVLVLLHTRISEPSISRSQSLEWMT